MLRSRDEGIVDMAGSRFFLSSPSLSNRNTRQAKTFWRAIAGSVTPPLNTRGTEGTRIIVVAVMFATIAKLESVEKYQTNKPDRFTVNSQII